MKKALYAFVAFLLFFGTVSAQDAEDLYDDAKKAYSSFITDNSKTDELATAVNKIEAAMEADISAMKKEKDKAEVYLLAGDIYAEIINQITIAKTADSSPLAGLTQVNKVEDLPQVRLPAIKAAEAYMEALQFKNKKGDPAKQSDVENKLASLQGNIQNAGIFALRDEDYGRSHLNFMKSLEVHNFLKAVGKDSYLDAENKLIDEKYFAGITAIYSDNFAAAKPLYLELMAAEYPEASIYDGLYNIYVSEDNKAEALTYLQKGRELYPDNDQLLFTEINYYLGEKKLDVLIDRLKTAIQKQPENPSLYATLGSVNENLYEAKMKAGEFEEAQAYFDDAKSYYEQALEKDPEFSSAIYSIGALYFNRGAIYSQEQQKLSDDLSREGQKKYEDLGEQVKAEFTAALPYFQRAEKLDPNDANVLIALKEIYARQNEYEMSNEFKARYEQVAAGETLTSYFANN